ncbi:hypothetical protein Y032_0004g2182 [Ancylostoma ceylanicum]|uniref:Uncharacterized protein n=1 Tax=Ancylostoma ceylanicum TaxID=53326 RepID=A0A016VVR7_9BILA|nr:hypothetical protein Y032_0004g2182 [Ancylostoma ceylanicum]
MLLRLHLPPASTARLLSRAAPPMHYHTCCEVAQSTRSLAEGKYFLERLYAGLPGFSSAFANSLPALSSFKLSADHARPGPQKQIPGYARCLRLPLYSSRSIAPRMGDFIFDTY